MRASLVMLLCLLVASVTTSFAATNEVWNLTSETSTSKNWHFQKATYRDAFVTVYAEGGAWQVALMQTAEDGFQDLENKFVFKTQQEALSQASSLMQNYEPQILDRDGFTPTDNEPLWQVTKQWNWDWEIRFGEWIAREIDIDLFYKHKVETDCADVPVYLRWIFARMHGLPAANRLMGSEQMMSQDSVRNEWANLPTGDEWWQDKKFLRMVDYITANSNTHSIVDDAYSIAIHSNSLFEGAFHVILHTVSGHARVVYRTSASNKEGALPFLIMDSNLPRMVRILAHGPFWEEEQPRKKSEGGFFRFRWPVKEGARWTLMDSDEMPYYSLEQYSSDFLLNKSYALTVMLRLRPDLNFDKAFDFGLQSVIDKLNERVPVVEQGYKFCQQNDCAPGTINYQNWSTPSRDQRIGSIIAQTEEIIRLAVESGHKTDLRWQEAQTKDVLALNETKFTLGELVEVWDKTLFSSDPRSSIQRRWGLKFRE